MKKQGYIDGFNGSEDEDLTDDFVEFDGCQMSLTRLYE